MSDETKIETPAPRTPSAPRRFSRPVLVGTVALLGLAAVGAGMVAAQDARPSARTGCATRRAPATCAAR